MQLQTKLNVLEKTLEGIYTYELKTIREKIDLISTNNKNSLILSLNQDIIKLQKLNTSEEFYLKALTEILIKLRIHLYKIVDKDLDKVLKSSVFDVFPLLNIYANDNSKAIDLNLIIKNVLIIYLSLLEDIQPDFNLLKEFEIYFLFIITISVFSIKDKKVQSIIEDLENE